MGWFNGAGTRTGEGRRNGIVKMGCDVVTGKRETRGAARASWATLSCTAQRKKLTFISTERLFAGVLRVSVTSPGLQVCKADNGGLGANH